MANDSTLPVRRAVLVALKNDAPLLAIVPKAQIHPQTVPPTPTWPFIRHGAPSGIPITASCVDGQEITFALHGFAKPRLNGSGQVVETAEDHAARIGAAMAKALDGKLLPLDTGHKARIRWTGSQLLQDGAEADAFHTIQNFRARIIS